ncbi:glycosyltransferase [Parvularcula lutaonensis]|uniref:Glycosyltransferase n=1 Tax=Parvularcula lutaonensis TaxID=491923 RepID=A0ABV7M723_9PROT|nr:glycosyltransferase [Parvularcula lutaonensis]GGY56485.1 hypothetical protein GCM10007148_27570 [Parvularcula lutaonensis]
MLISIVTPVLNGERFLRETLESVRSQSEVSFEHITVDGGSEDSTTAIVQEFAHQDPRFRLVESPGTSQYEAIDIGFSQSRGQIIAWLNADDMYLPWAFSTVLRWKTAFPKERWVTGFPACWDETGALTYLKPLASWPRWMIREGWFHDGLLGYLQQESMFFDRTLYDGLPAEERKKFTSARLAGDFILWRAFARNAHLSTIPTLLGGFRRHGDNRSEKQAEAYRQEVLATAPRQLPNFIGGRLRSAFLRWSANQALMLSLSAERSHLAGEPSG